MGSLIIEQKGKLKSCASDMDGECCHPQCPQNRDKEPETSGRDCPLVYLTWRE